MLYYLVILLNFLTVLQIYLLPKSEDTFDKQFYMRGYHSNVYYLSFVTNVAYYYF